MKTLIFSVAAICTFSSLLVQTVKGQFNYSDNGNGTCTITSYSGSGGAVTIPANISGLAVSTIGIGAFSGLPSLTSIAIPNGVAVIGVDAFSGCARLASVSIPTSVTSIAQEAFENCTSLTSVTIPNNVTIIGDYSFEECTSQTTVTNGASLGQYEFVDCYNLTSVYFTGNAPINVGPDQFQSDAKATAYYLPGTTGWSSFSAATGLPAVMLSIPATITAQPQSVVVNAYGSAAFTVTAYGTTPLDYQWMLNGSNISGATDSTLAFSSVDQTNLGTYSVVVANAFATNAMAPTSCCRCIRSSRPSSMVQSRIGDKATLSAYRHGGTEPLSFQWFDNGNAIADATNETLTFANIQATNAGLYSVVVTSSLGSATNAPAQVIVEPAGVSLRILSNANNKRGRWLHVHYSKLD